MSTGRKLTTLTYADKLKAIEAVKSGIKRKDVASQFNIKESTLSLILKKEPELLKKQELGESLQSKRGKVASFPILEQYLFSWYIQCQNQNITVNGPMLKLKAQEFAETLKINKFKASNGWLGKFKKRHNLNLKKTEVKEGERVNQDWRSEFHNIVNVFVPNDHFTEGETKVESVKENSNDQNESLPPTTVSIDEVRRALMTVQAFIEQCRCNSERY